MSPMAQVGHVLWKDMREHRVRLGVFVVVVGVALARGLGFATSVDSTLLSVITFLTGLAIVGAPVDGDAPTDPRSAWATRPLAPRAVAAAKLVFALLLVLAATVAQAVAVRSLDAPPGALATYVVRPALVFGYVLLAVLVVSAASADPKRRLLLILALALAIGSALAKFSAAEGAPLRLAAPVVGAAAPLLMVATVAWFYRRRPIGMAPIAVAFLVVFVAGLGDPGGSAPDRVPAAGSDVPRPVLRLKPAVERPTVQDGAVQLQFDSKASVRGWKYALRGIGVEVTLASGRVVHATTDRNEANLDGDMAPLPLPMLERGNGADTLRAQWQVIAARMPTRLEGEAITRVTLTASLLAANTRATDTIPLVVGGSHVRSGVRSMVDSVTLTGVRPLIVMRTEGFFKPQPGPGLFAFTSFYGRTYALVGIDGRVVPLQQTWKEGSSGGLVLPTGKYAAAALRLEPVKAPAGTSPANDPHWLASARLVAYEPVIVGAAPVRMTWSVEEGSRTR